MTLLRRRKRLKRKLNVVIAVALFPCLAVNAACAALAWALPHKS